MSSLSLEKAQLVHHDFETGANGEVTNYYFASGMEIYAQTHGVRFLFQCNFLTNHIGSLRFRIKVETKLPESSRIETHWQSIAENIREANGLRFVRRYAILWSALCEEKMACYGVKGQVPESQKNKMWPNFSAVDVAWICQSTGSFERELLNCGVPEELAKRCSNKNTAHSKKRTKSTWLLGAYWRAPECQEKLRALHESQNFSRCLNCSGSTSISDGTQLVWKTVPGHPYTLRLYASTAVELPSKDTTYGSNGSTTANGTSTVIESSTNGEASTSGTIPGEVGQQPVPTVQTVQKLLPLLLEPRGNYIENAAGWMNRNLVLCERCSSTNKELVDRLNASQEPETVGNHSSTTNLDMESEHNQTAASSGTSNTVTNTSATPDATTNEKQEQENDLALLLQAFRKEQARRCVRHTDGTTAAVTTHTGTQQGESSRQVAKQSAPQGTGQSNPALREAAEDPASTSPASTSQGQLPSEDADPQFTEEQLLQNDVLNAQITVVIDELNRALRHHISNFVHSNNEVYTEFQKLMELTNGDKQSESNPVVNCLLYIISRYLQDYQISTWSKLWTQKTTEHLRHTGSKMSQLDAAALAKQHCNPLWFFIQSLTLSRRANHELKRMISQDPEHHGYLKNRLTRRIRILGMLQHEGSNNLMTLLDTSQDASATDGSRTESDSHPDNADPAVVEDQSSAAATRGNSKRKYYD